MSSFALGRRVLWFMVKGGILVVGVECPVVPCGSLVLWLPYANGGVSEFSTRRSRFVGRSFAGRLGAVVASHIALK